jgi:dimethylargininase
MLKNEGDRLTRVVVCTPNQEYFRIDDIKAHNINEVADRERTREQHGVLKSIMAGLGCKVIDVPELARHPNSVFTRDVALSTPRGYVRLRMGLETRRGEDEWMADILDSLGEPHAGTITQPATVEGGDIVMAGSVAFVGRSERTNEEGVKQITELLRDMGCRVRTTEVRGSLHIGGLMSAIGPRRILCCGEMFPGDFFRGFETVDVPYRGPSTGNVICLAENEVIANAAENSEAIKILESNGVKVHGIDLSEFRKGSGGPTCLILPVDRV